MTKIDCEEKNCKYNKNGICDNDEIQLVFDLDRFLFCLTRDLK